MQRVKQRIDSGAVCEQLVFNLPDGRKLKNAEPRFRFETEEDREKHRIGISKRHHARLVNANFGPESIYSTLTMDDEHEVHTFEEARRVRKNYVERLRRAFPKAKITIYMGRGKSTSRIHFHMLSDGIPAEVIEGKWKEGRIVRSDYLRESTIIITASTMGGIIPGWQTTYSTTGRQSRAVTDIRPRGT